MSDGSGKNSLIEGGCRHWRNHGRVESRLLITVIRGLGEGGGGGLYRHFYNITESQPAYSHTNPPP